MGLYKGIGAVVTGIVPKMAIRFASFEGAFAVPSPLQFDASLLRSEQEKTDNLLVRSKQHTRTPYPTLRES
jgi:hypothetical protein